MTRHEVTLYVYRRTGSIPYPVRKSGYEYEQCSAACTCGWAIADAGWYTVDQQARQHLADVDLSVLDPTEVAETYRLAKAAVRHARTDLDDAVHTVEACEETLTAKLDELTVAEDAWRASQGLPLQQRSYHP